MSEAMSVAPLSHQAPIVAGEESLIAMTEIVGRRMIDLRVRPEDKSAFDAVRTVLGFDLPGTPRCSSGTGDRCALWLSIDQWLITSPLAASEDQIEALKAVLNGHVASVTDLSDARTVIRLEGAGACDIIKKGSQGDTSGLDRVAGDVSRLPLAEIPVIAHFVQTDAEIIDLYVDRSFGESAWTWLVRASRKEAECRPFSPQVMPPV